MTHPPTSPNLTRTRVTTITETVRYHAHEVTLIEGEPAVRLSDLRAFLDACSQMSGSERVVITRPFTDAAYFTVEQVTEVGHA